MRKVLLAGAALMLTAGMAMAQTTTNNGTYPHSTTSGSSGMSTPKNTLGSSGASTNSTTENSGHSYKAPNGHVGGGTGSASSGSSSGSSSR